jgi:hypothetical protein
MPVPPLPALPPGDAAFDVLSDYFLAAVTAAGDDDTALREAIANSVRGFYDAMEAGGQERGMYCGHFYWVDGVALDDTDRAVPLNRVRAQLGDPLAEKIIAIWDSVEDTVD